MKTFIFVLLAFTGLSATADVSTPIIVKSSGGGHSPDQYVYAERCEVFSDKVVIRKEYGVGESKTTLSQTLNIELEGDMQQIVALAAMETLEEKENTRCDTPTTSIKTSGPVPLLLYNTGGCGFPQQERHGPYSLRLKDIVNTFCPRTF